MSRSNVRQEFERLHVNDGEVKQEEEENDHQDTSNKPTSREAALQYELETVRNINQVIEGVLSSLHRAKSNMSVCYTSLVVTIDIHTPRYVMSYHVISDS